MSDHTLIAFVFALVTGFILLYAFFVFKNVRKVVAYNNSSSVTTKTVCINGECRSVDDDDDDVIIIGAGVAGAALAHTLGKASGPELHKLYMGPSPTRQSQSTTGPN
ncbi:squalene monooxygenase-like protein [Tanacetum coccineum]